ncbi:MAG: methyltransferase domain-containing protein, partial [Candidatus Firestonebacteria bacterium]|nr:methyltransferase domain-containing protein [Candidatus Firestonebacteria bacterium]
MKCRFCGNELTHEFINLFNAPTSNSFLSREQLDEPEVFFPLKLFVCSSCFLVQIDEYKKSEDIFNNEYAYFSSFSTTWLEHSKKYSEKMIDRFKLSQNSLVIEIASNDGYLLQYFNERKIPCLGIEPTKNTAKKAKEKGLDVIEEFFCSKLAKKFVEKNKKADLLIGNNVLAHVPDINDFVEGLKIVLKDNGIISMEFPHVMQLIENNQFDTIYHEHFSYFSLLTVKMIFEKHDLEIFDVDELPTHGGSLRIYAQHKKEGICKKNEGLEKVIAKEKLFGMDSIHYYQGFQAKAEKIKISFLDFLIKAKQNEKKVMA